MSATAEFIQNNFKIITVLKAGANGITELVTDATNAVCIRKTVNGTGLPYSALAQMNINGLPKIYYCAEADGKTYVVEEYINGVNLQDELEQGKIFTEKQVLQIALQLCDVLLAIHSKGILHRDIKPGNIILQNGSAWLIDFGAAKTVSGDKTQDSRILGTPGFAPPEQYGFSTTDMRSDIYALGKTMQALLGEKYNGKLKGVIAKCTQFDPQKRIASAAELKKLLLQTPSNSKNRVAIAVAVLAILTSGYYYLNLPQQDTAQPQQPAVTETQKDTRHEATNEQDVLPASKEETVQRTQEVQEQITADLTVKNLDFLISTNPLYQTAKEQGKQAGLTLLELPKGKIPTFTVHNDSGQELKNPKLIIQFTNLMVTGNNLTADSWGGRQINWQLAKNNQGYAGTVTISLSGTIPSDDYFDYPLAGAVANYYTSGSPAAAQVTLTADNLEPLTQTYNIKIN